jgi:hypothetical protein
MHPTGLLALSLLAFTTLSQANTVVIPISSFNSYTTLEQYWNYLYPWGSDHNGCQSAHITPLLCANVSLLRSCPHERKFHGSFAHLRFK